MIRCLKCSGSGRVSRGTLGEQGEDACPRCGGSGEVRDVSSPPANSMLDEIDAGRKLAVALRRYLDMSELGQANVATPEDEREFKFRALDVYNALNRCEALMPKRPDGEER